jgi:prevent-host-death family protein
MPIIKPSISLKNNYDEISAICHQTKKPVYITKNGSGDLAILSIELYENLTERSELYEELNKEMQDFREVKIRSIKRPATEIENRL